MSDQQNVSLIQKLLEAFGRGDVQTILNHCDENTVFYCPGPAVVPYTGTKKGQSEIEAYFGSLIGTQSDAKLSIGQFVAQNDTVVAIGHYSAKVKATGKPIDTPVVLTFQLQDGNIGRHTVMGDTAALAASYTASAATAS